MTASAIPGPAPAQDPGDAARLALAKEATEVSARAKATSDKMRGRSDAWGKGLTTLGTATVGYLGLTRATDVFPIPTGWGWLSMLAMGCLVLMAVSAISLGWRLSRVGRAVIMKNDPKAIPDLNKTEEAEVAQLYAAYAKLNGCTTLDEYDKRGQAIAATYEQHDANTPVPTEPFSRAVQIRAEVKSAQQRAATLVIRRRVTKTTTGFLTMASICAFVTAGAVFGVTTDKVADLRTTTADTLATIKHCGEASAAKKTYPTITVELPPACTG